jgi:hypothetical protein
MTVKLRCTDRNLRKIPRQALESPEQGEFLGVVGIHSKRKVPKSIGDG